MSTDSYTLKATGVETTPFATYEAAYKFGRWWLGQFSMFGEVLLYKNGVLIEKIDNRKELLSCKNCWPVLDLDHTWLAGEALPKAGDICKNCGLGKIEVVGRVRT